jgi:hypothetical protein
MDYGFDDHGLLGLADWHGKEAQNLAAPDWRRLKVRFAAKHALYHDMLAPCHAHSAGGAFAEAGSAVLARQRAGSSDVNLDALGNGKTRSATQHGIADHSGTAPEKPDE